MGTQCGGFCCCIFVCRFCHGCVNDVMAGAYANSVMVVHTPSEFCLEFISNFYPQAVIDRCS